MIKKCNKTKCDLFSWTAVFHCKYNLINDCKQKVINKNNKYVKKSNQSSPDTKGTDKV